MQYSDNAAAGRILDRLSGAISGPNLRGRAFEEWQEKRLRVSRYFQKAGFDGIYLSIKNYPIPGYALPGGRDRQMWTNPKLPKGNRITAAHTTRLMYDIVSGYAVSPQASGKMLDLLYRELSLDDEAVYGFLSQPLAGKNVEVYQKIGWTSDDRDEVAYITTRDGSVQYILVVLGDDRSFANSYSLFPAFSKIAFDGVSALK